MKHLILLLLLALGNRVEAHQFLPTYPKLEPSYVEGVLVAKMELLNNRKDVTYYEIGVFDAEWTPVPFASEANIIEVSYLQRKNLDIYIREKDRQNAVYICTKSKHIEDRSQVTIVSSKICSKIK